MFRYIQAFDLRTFRSVFEYTSHPTLTRMALAISRTADGWLYVLLLPTLIQVMKPEHISVYVQIFIIGFCIERGFYYLFKNIFRRKRPPQAIKGFRSAILASDEFSLPSGHTSAAFLVTTILCFNFSILFLPLYLWAGAVGISRVILGVHFPTDILSGALLGTWIAILVT